MGLFKFDCKFKEWAMMLFLYSLCRAPCTIWNCNASLQMLIDGWIEMDWSVGKDMSYLAPLVPRELVVSGPAGVPLASHIKF